VLWMVAAGAWSWSQKQYYVGEQDGVVTVFRGVQADLPGIALSHPYETTDVQVTDLDAYSARQVQQGIGASDLTDAERTVQRLADNRKPAS
jgi:PPM family protein phosphatase